MYSAFIPVLATLSMCAHDIWAAFLGMHAGWLPQRQRIKVRSGLTMYSQLRMEWGVWAHSNAAVGALAIQSSQPNTELQKTPCTT